MPNTAGVAEMPKPYRLQKHFGRFNRLDQLYSKDMAHETSLRVEERGRIFDEDVNRDIKEELSSAFNETPLRETETESITVVKEELIANAPADCDPFHSLPITDIPHETPCSFAEDVVAKKVRTMDMVIERAFEDAFADAYDCRTPEEVDMKNGSTSEELITNSPHNCDSIQIKDGPCVESAGKENEGMCAAFKRDAEEEVPDCEPLKERINGEKPTTVKGGSSKFYPKHWKNVEKYIPESDSFENGNTKYKIKMFPMQRDEEAAFSDHFGEKSHNVKIEKLGIKDDCLKRILTVEKTLNNCIAGRQFVNGKGHTKSTFKNKVQESDSALSLSVYTADEDLPEHDDTAVEDNMMLVDDADRLYGIKSQCRINKHDFLKQSAEEDLPVHENIVVEEDKKTENSYFQYFSDYQEQMRKKQPVTNKFELADKSNSLPNGNLLEFKANIRNEPNGVENFTKTNRYLDPPVQTSIKRQKPERFSKQKRHKSLPGHQMEGGMFHKEANTYDEHALAELDEINSLNHELQLKISYIMLKVEKDRHDLIRYLLSDLIKTLNIKFHQETNELTQISPIDPGTCHYLEKLILSYGVKYGDTMHLIGEIAEWVRLMYNNSEPMKQDPLTNNATYCNDQNVRSAYKVSKNKESKETQCENYKWQQANLETSYQRENPENKICCYVCGAEKSDVNKFDAHTKIGCTVPKGKRHHEYVAYKKVLGNNGRRRLPKKIINNPYKPENYDDLKPANSSYQREIGSTKDQTDAVHYEQFHRYFGACYRQKEPPKENVCYPHNRGVQHDGKFKTGYMHCGDLCRKMNDANVDCKNHHDQHTFRANHYGKNGSDHAQYDQNGLNRSRHNWKRKYSRKERKIHIFQKHGHEKNKKESKTKNFQPKLKFRKKQIWTSPIFNLKKEFDFFGLFLLVVCMLLFIYRFIL